MNNFFNRENELARLETLFRQRQTSSLAIIYGRRRLGKTALLKAFCRDKTYCYFMADRAGEAALKRSVSVAMSEALSEPLIQSAVYPEWYDLFSAFDRFRPKDEKVVLIFDEYQYLCQVQPAFSSFVQKWWDEKWKDDNLMLILCGSVTSMMYRETMSVSSPLYGRSDIQMLLSPLDYTCTRDFLPHLSETELVKMYSISGGVPRYLELLSAFDNFDDALISLALDRFGILYQEARYLLQDEINTPNTCWSILNGLGRGTGRISELGGLLNLPANQLTRYISLLKDLFLVYREVPVLEKNPEKSKKGFYQVVDPFLRLWFGTIYPYESFLEFGQTDLVVKRLRPMIHQHIAHCYEKLCQAYTKKRAGEFECVRVGRQWSGQYEIDVAGVSLTNELVLVGECKWSDNKVGVSVLNRLKKTLSDNHLPTAPGCRYLLFGKSGFTSELVDLAQKDPHIELVSALFAEQTANG